MKRSVLYILILQLLAIPASGQRNLDSLILKFEESATIKQAITAIEIADAQTGQIVAALNNHKALTPASTLKVLTTATALERLGSRYRFETKVYTTGQIAADGTLHGNLLIVGGGDPTLGSSYLTNTDAFPATWTNELKARGIKKIMGTVTVDAECYDREAVSAKWLIEDVGNYYAPGSYGVALFDNTYRLTLQCPSASEVPAITYCLPSMEGYLTFTNRLTKGTKNNIFIEGLPTNFNRIIKGSVTNGTDSIYVKGDIPDAPRYMEFYLRNCLASQGIEVVGNKVADAEPQLLTTTLSPPLGDIIKATNFRSINLFADHLLKQIGYEPKKEAGSGSFRTGLDAQNAFWSGKGIDLSGFTLHDGSGLAPADKISANALNKVLAYMFNKSTNKKTFIASLPKAGEEGSVAQLLKKGQTSATVLLKSGSMTGVRSYSGYIIKGDKTYCITILCNNFSTSVSAVTREISALLVEIANNL